MPTLVFTSFDHFSAAPSSKQYFEHYLRFNLLDSKAIVSFCGVKSFLVLTSFISFQQLNTFLSHKKKNVVTYLSFLLNYSRFVRNQYSCVGKICGIALRTVEKIVFFLLNPVMLLYLRPIKKICLGILY